MTRFDISRLLAAFGGLIAGLYGGWPGVMTVLVCFMAADYLLGCLCALLGKSVKTPGGRFLSSVAFAGLLKKAVIMLVVLLSVQLDRALGAGNAAFQTAIVFFYIASEGMSVLENCALLGVPIPSALRQTLEALREKSGSGGDSPLENAPEKRDDPPAL